MFRRAIIGILTLAATAAAVAQPAPAANTAAVLAAQTHWFETYAGCKAEEMARLVTEGMMFIHHLGLIDNKATFLKGVAGCGLSRIGSEQTNVRVLGDTAIVNGKLAWAGKNASSKGTFMQPTSSASFSTFLYSQVYVWRNGRWLLASHQSTAVPLAE